MLFNLANFLCMGSGTAAGTEGQKGSSVTMIIMMVVMLVVMYFIMIRPQKKKQQEEQKLRDSVQIGDEITTIGGINGRVVTVKEDSIVLETGADRTKLRFQKWAIQTNNTANDRMAAERQAAADAKKAKSEQEAIDQKINGKKSKKEKIIEVKNEASEDLPKESVNDIPEEE